MFATALRYMLVLMLLLVGTFAVPLMSGTGVAVVAGDDGTENDDRGKGNGKDKKDDGKDDREAVTADAGYTVDVTCEHAAGGSTCTFSPVVPEGQKKVSHLLVPESILCADVIQTGARYVDPEPRMQQTGYLSRGAGPDVVIQLSGNVEVAGTSTYWLKAAGTIHPAEGPGLACDAASAREDATPPAATGTVVIEARACGGIDPELDDIDWFGACQPETDAHGYQLAQVTEQTNPLHTAESDGSGVATFTGLAPGSYNLDDTGDRWCHAESDRVDANSNLIVEAGAVTTVWLFYCDDGSNGSS